MTQPPRIGVFGGTFDPPHLGHVAVVEAARDCLDLDEVLVVVSGRPPHRDEPTTPAETRYVMAREAFEGTNRVTVTRHELDTRTGGPSYTVETLERIATEHPGHELVLLVGGDQAAAFMEWHRWQDIARMAALGVGERPAVVDSDELAGELAALEQAGVGVVRFPMEPHSAASSLVRERVRARDIRGAGELVPAAVVPFLAATYSA